jgi:hypothetical protein
MAKNNLIFVPVVRLQNSVKQNMQKYTGTRVPDIQSVLWIRIRIGNTDPYPDPGGPNWPTKVKKIQVFKC